MLGTVITSAIIHTSCAMSNQSLSVCLKDCVRFQDNQTRYVYAKMFWCHGVTDKSSYPAM